MAQKWMPSTNRSADWYASECLRRARARTTATAFGYKLQVLAAHVLLRLNHRIMEVNSSGHPDIVSIKNGLQFRFEIEAEVTTTRKRRLTDADFRGLLGGSKGLGYFALAVSLPKPRWILVPASKLLRRHMAAGNALLEALCDEEYSATWTQEYIELLLASCGQIRRRSFNQLVQMALEGRRL